MGHARWAHILIPATVALLLIGALLGFTRFGMSMTMDEHGNMEMSDCYMPGMTTLCTMDVLDHMAWWQSMFASIPAQNLMLALLLLVASAVVFGFIQQIHSPPRQLQTRYRVRNREYIPPASSLQELFSNGILNPKLF